MAVAITLLVLDLHASPEAGSSLAHQLVSEWPSFAAYLVSFFIIGIIWVNHHALMALVARIDRVLLFVNLVLLLFVTTIPFTTSTLAAYLREGGADARVAVVLYGISMEGMAVSFTVILAHLVHHQLMHEPVDPATGRRAVRRFGLGTLVYPLVVVVGLVSAPLMLLLYAVLAGFYVVEQTPILGRVDRG
jgi:uncharacterized membrane protein